MTNNLMKIKEGAIMRKSLDVFFVIYIVFVLTSCQTMEPLDPDLTIALEINNIPDINIGWSGLAAVHVAEESGSIEDPQLGIRVDANIYSGLLKYKSGTEFKVKDVRKNKRYMVIFIMLQEGQPTVTMYSKQFVIKSETIRLDFNSDLFSDPKEALVRNL
jgi:hypothetical protein